MMMEWSRAYFRFPFRYKWRDSFLLLLRRADEDDAEECHSYPITMKIYCGSQFDRIQMINSYLSSRLLSIYLSIQESPSPVSLLQKCLSLLY